MSRRKQAAPRPIKQVEQDHYEHFDTGAIRIKEEPVDSDDLFDENDDLDDDGDYRWVIAEEGNEDDLEGEGSRDDLEGQGSREDDDYDDTEDDGLLSKDGLETDELSEHPEDGMEEGTEEDKTGEDDSEGGSSQFGWSYTYKDGRPMCRYCGRSFMSIGGLKIHSHRCREEKAKKAKEHRPANPEVQCWKCKAIFSTRSSMKRHEKKCGKLYFRSRPTRDMGTTHCNYCKKEFLTRSLMKHLSRCKGLTSSQLQMQHRRVILPRDPGAPVTIPSPCGSLTTPVSVTPTMSNVATSVAPTVPVQMTAPIQVATPVQMSTPVQMTTAPMNTPGGNVQQITPAQQPVTALPQLPSGIMMASPVTNTGTQPQIQYIMPVASSGMPTPTNTTAPIIVVANVAPPGATVVGSMSGNIATGSSNVTNILPSSMPAQSMATYVPVSMVQNTMKSVSSTTVTIPAATVVSSNPVTVGTSTSNISATGITSTVVPMMTPRVQTSQTPSMIRPAPQTPSMIRPTPKTPSMIRPAPQTPSMIRPAPKTPSMIRPAPQTPSIIRPASQTPSMIRPAPQTPSIIRPAPQTPSMIQPAVVAKAPPVSSPVITSISGVTTNTIPTQSLVIPAFQQSSTISSSIVQPWSQTQQSNQPTNLIQPQIVSVPQLTSTVTSTVTNSKPTNLTVSESNSDRLAPTRRSPRNHPPPAVQEPDSPTTSKDEMTAIVPCINGKVAIPRLSRPIGGRILAKKPTSKPAVILPSHYSQRQRSRTNAQQSVTPKVARVVMDVTDLSKVRKVDLFTEKPSDKTLPTGQQSKTNPDKLKGTQSSKSTMANIQDGNKDGIQNEQSDKTLPVPTAATQQNIGTNTAVKDLTDTPTPGNLLSHVNMDNKVIIDGKEMQIKREPSSPGPEGGGIQATSNDNENVTESVYVAVSIKDEPVKNEVSQGGESEEMNYAIAIETEKDNTAGQSDVLEHGHQQLNQDIVTTATTEQSDTNTEPECDKNDSDYVPSESEGGEDDEEEVGMEPSGRSRNPIHRADGQLECEECGRLFGCVRNYNRHYPSHIEDRRFKCNVCGKTFHLSYHLKEHMNKHYDLRPYKCHLCGKAYNHSGTLSGHLKMAHKNENIPMRDVKKCKYCCKVFAYEGTYYRHLEDRHGVKMQRIYTPPTPGSWQTVTSIPVGESGSVSEMVELPIVNFKHRSMGTKKKRLHQGDLPQRVSRKRRAARIAGTLEDEDKKQSEPSSHLTIANSFSLQPFLEYNDPKYRVLLPRHETCTTQTKDSSYVAVPMSASSATTAPIMPSTSAPVVASVAVSTTVNTAATLTPAPLPAPTTAPLVPTVTQAVMPSISTTFNQATGIQPIVMAPVHTQTVTMSTIVQANQPPQPLSVSSSPSEPVMNLQGSTLPVQQMIMMEKSTDGTAMTSTTDGTAVPSITTITAAAESEKMDESSLDTDQIIRMTEKIAKQYHCQYCTLKFSTKLRLSFHVTRDHSSRPMNSISHESKVRAMGKTNKLVVAKYRCVLCLYFFRDIPTLRRHIAGFHRCVNPDMFLADIMREHEDLSQRGFLCRRSSHSTTASPLRERSPSELRSRSEEKDRRAEHEEDSVPTVSKSTDVISQHPATGACTFQHEGEHKDRTSEIGETSSNGDLSDNCLKIVEGDESSEGIDGPSTDDAMISTNLDVTGDKSEQNVDSIHTTEVSNTTLSSENQPESSSETQQKDGSKDKSGKMKQTWLCMLPSHCTVESIPDCHTVFQKCPNCHAQFVCRVKKNSPVTINAAKISHKCPVCLIRFELGFSKERDTLSCLCSKCWQRPKNTVVGKPQLCVVGGETLQKENDDQIKNGGTERNSNHGNKGDGGEENEDNETDKGIVGIECLPCICQKCNCKFYQVIDTEKVICTKCNDIVTRDEFPNHTLIHRTTHNKPSKPTQNECRICYRTVSDLEAHIRSSHKTLKDVEEEVKYQQESGMYKCNRCGQMYVTRYSLKRHIQINHKGGGIRHKCDVCNQSFMHASHLANHKRIIHDKQGNFKCQVCQKKFTHPGALSNHRKHCQLYKYSYYVSSKK
ncbi:uncharacterized protein LOC144447221 [Glandiceps talaboti]